MTLFKSLFLTLIGTLTISASSWSCYPEASLTPDVYWAAQPPAVRELRNLPPDTKLEKAAVLATQGYIIDLPIQGWGWDPVCTMGMRKQLGYTWVPNILQAGVTVVPGILFPSAFPDHTTYDPNNPPSGSIKVSIDKKDYQEFTPPPPPPPVTLPVVGTCFTNTNICQALVAAYKLSNGQLVTQDGVVYQLHLMVGPFGESRWFEVWK